MIKELFEGPVGDYCIARNTIKCLFNYEKHNRDRKNSLPNQIKMVLAKKPSNHTSPALSHLIKSLPIPDCNVE